MKKLRTISQHLNLNAGHSFMVDFICAWCGKILGKMPAKKNMASHGICQQCLKTMLAEHNTSNGKMEDEGQTLTG